MFKELKKDKISNVEQSYSEFWKENNILEKSIEKVNVDPEL